jgi:hypothetical protein
MGRAAHRTGPAVTGIAPQEQRRPVGFGCRAGVGSGSESAKIVAAEDFAGSWRIIATFNGIAERLNN